MRASTPFDGGDYRKPLHEECLKHLGHKGNPGVTPEICGAGGERAE
jgi:hypothetical protein